MDVKCGRVLCCEYVCECDASSISSAISAISASSISSVSSVSASKCQ